MFLCLWRQHPFLHKTKGLTRNPISPTPTPPSAGVHVSPPPPCRAIFRLPCGGARVPPLQAHACPCPTMQGHPEAEEDMAVGCTAALPRAPVPRPSQRRKRTRLFSRTTPPDRATFVEREGGGAFWTGPTHRTSDPPGPHPPLITLWGTSFVSQPEAKALSRSRIYKRGGGSRALDPPAPRTPPLCNFILMHVACSVPRKT